MKTLRAWFPFLLAVLVVGGVAAAQEFGPEVMKRNVVSRTGDTMTGPLLAPSFTATGTTAATNGISLISANVLGLDTNGTHRVYLDNTTLTSSTDAVMSLGTSGRAWKDLWISGAAPQFTSSGTGVMRMESNANDAATSSSVAAMQFRQTVALTSSDLVFEFQNNAGSRILAGDNNGQVLLNGQLTFPSNGQTLLMSLTPDSITSPAVPAAAIREGVNITDGDLLFAFQNSVPANIWTIDEQGIVSNPGGFSAAASSSLTGGANWTMSGGGTSTGIFQCGNSTGDRCLIRNQIGASAATNAIAAIQLEQENGALGANDLFISMKDEGTQLWAMDAEGDIFVKDPMTFNVGGTAFTTINTSSGASFGWGSKILNFDTNGARFSDTGNAGSCTLNGASPATCTATVRASTRCTCAPVGTTTAVSNAGCAVSLSSTTLTITSANGSAFDVNYICL